VSIVGLIAFSKTPTRARWPRPRPVVPSETGGRGTGRWDLPFIVRRQPPRAAHQQVVRRPIGRRPWDGYLNARRKFDGAQRPSNVFRNTIGRQAIKTGNSFPGGACRFGGVSCAAPGNNQGRVGDRSHLPPPRATPRTASRSGLLFHPHGQPQGPRRDPVFSSAGPGNHKGRPATRWVALTPELASADTVAATAAGHGTGTSVPGDKMMRAAPQQCRPEDDRPQAIKTGNSFPGGRPDSSPGPNQARSATTTRPEDDRPQAIKTGNSFPVGASPGSRRFIPRTDSSPPRIHSPGGRTDSSYERIHPPGPGNSSHEPIHTVESTGTMLRLCVTTDKMPTCVRPHRPSTSPMSG